MSDLSKAHDRQFRELVDQKLPEYIKYNDVLYARSAYMLMGGGFKVDYAPFYENKSGNMDFDWMGKRLIDNKHYYHGEPIDVIDQILTDLSKLEREAYDANISYHIVPKEHVLTTQEWFEKELSDLLTKYKKNTNIPNNALTHYLIGCMRNFKVCLNNMKR